MADVEDLSLTWEHDLQPLIESVLPRDAGIDVAVYMNLANLSVALLNIQCGGFDAYWNNDSDDEDYGTLRLSGSDCTFPPDLLEAKLDGVYWAKSRLTFRTEGELTARDPSWRTRVGGTPAHFTFTSRGLKLDLNPGNDTGGPLEVWGLGCMPKFSEAANAPNPLEYLNSPSQWGPAFYVLGHLPLWERSREDIIAIQADYRGQWKVVLENAGWGVKTRKYPPMRS